MRSVLIVRIQHLALTELNIDSIKRNSVYQAPDPSIRERALGSSSNVVSEAPSKASGSDFIERENAHFLFAPFMWDLS